MMVVLKFKLEIESETGAKTVALVENVNKMVLDEENDLLSFSGKNCTANVQGMVFNSEDEDPFFFKASMVKSITLV